MTLKIKQKDNLTVNRNHRRILYIALTTFMIFCIQIATVQAAIADVLLKDVQTIIRTINFLESTPKTSEKPSMAIIYDPNNTHSLSDARQMETLIKTDRKNFTTQLVPISSINSMPDATYAFVTNGLQSNFPTIKDTLGSKNILSFTLDRSCVEQDTCAVYINSENRVEIVINKDITDATQAAFKPVFLMMVTVL